MGTIADNFYPGTQDPLKGEDLLKRIRQETDEIALAFSYGKDSIAMYLAIKDHFKRVVPFFREFVPGLNFIERRIRYYEEKLDTHIVRVNHPNFYRMIRNALWQPPHRVAMIDALNIPDVTYLQVNELVFKDQGLNPKTTFTAVGVRAADSLQRRTTVKVRGAINWTERAFWPIWDWSHQDTAAIIQAHNIQLAPEYEWWGTSFDGLRWFFLKDIQTHYPDDMELRRRELKDQPYPAEEES